MKIRVEHGEYEENEIIIRCKELDEQMIEILGLINEYSSKLGGTKEGETHLIKPKDILYIESVDGKSFMYTKDEVLEIQDSLSSLASKYGDLGFVRISKGQLCNLNHVSEFKSLPNSKIEITLDNEEKLIVSRTYIQDIMEKLKIKGGRKWYE